MPMSTTTTEAPFTPRKEALELLLEAHEHLRHFAELATRLGHSRGVPPTELSQSASRIIRYFTLGLPLHLEDEDDSLLPHLLATAPPLEALQALWELSRQHEALERVVDELVPLWGTVRDRPEQHLALSEKLVVGGRRLQVLLEEHLSLEEQRLFPLARARLSEETLQRIAREILDRRGQLA